MVQKRALVRALVASSERVQSACAQHDAGSGRLSPRLFCSLLEEAGVQVDDSLGAVLDGCVTGKGVDFRLFYRVVSQAAKQVAESDAAFWTELGMGSAHTVAWTTFRQKLLAWLPHDAKVRLALTALQRLVAVEGKVT